MAGALPDEVSPALQMLIGGVNGPISEPIVFLVSWCGGAGDADPARRADRVGVIDGLERVEAGTGSRGVGPLMGREPVEQRFALRMVMTLNCRAGAHDVVRIAVFDTGAGADD